MDWPVTPAAYAAYLAVMTAMAFTPGPANLFSIATGLAAGPRAVIAGVAGMTLATATWFAASALGLGWLIRTYPQAFEILRYAGAAYVAFLGLQALRAAWIGKLRDFEARPGAAGWRGVRDGYAVQIANPKALIFFTAVLPPFMDPDRAAGPQLALFAATTLTLDVIAMTAYGLAGGLLAARARDRTFSRAFDAATGVLLLIAAGLTLVAH
jgi:threonine/homoserine/homoserine lactone efflux protein